MCHPESTLCHSAGGRKPAHVETTLQKAEVAQATSVNLFISDFTKQEVLTCLKTKELQLHAYFLFFCLQMINATCDSLAALSKWNHWFHFHESIWLVIINLFN